jgi:hypothetical protein
VDLADDQTVSRVALGEFPTIEDVLEGGEYQQVTVGERREQWSISKAGNRFAYTYESILRDDTDAMLRLPQMFGASARRKQGDVVYAILTGNPVMGDGINLFDADHDNVGTGAAPSATTIAEMQKLFMIQTGIGGVETIGVPMRYIIVPEVLRFSVEQLLSGAYMPTSAANAVTASQRGLSVISDARLDSSSPLKWYAAASPMEIDTIEYGFLQGEGGPVLETYEDPDHDAYIIKVRQFFGAKAVDWRGLGYNEGS